MSAVDLSKLPPPSVLGAFSYEAILADMMADFAARAPDQAAALLPSDPVTKLLQAMAWHSLLKKQEMRECALSLLLAYAEGADLEQLAANYNVGRQLIDAGDATAVPPRAATWESDERLRERAQMAFEGLTVAGPVGAYIFHAKSADPRVLDVSVLSPSPGVVQVHLLSAEGDGIASADLLARVAAALNKEDVRPLTDQVDIQPATRMDYEIHAVLELYRGPDAGVVRDAALEALRAFVAGQRRLGEPVTLDGIYKALRTDGVRKVTLHAPTENVEPDLGGFGHCTAIAVEVM